MFRHLIRSRVVSTRISPVTSASSFKVSSVSFVRFNSSKSEVEQRLEQLSGAIESSPELQKSITTLKEIFESKGLTGSKPPSMFQMSMLLMDKNVSGALKKFYGELQEANINFSPDDMKLLLKMYGQK